jgi:SAM-dependent methyltransferase
MANADKLYKASMILTRLVHPCDSVIVAGCGEEADPAAIFDDCAVIGLDIEPRPVQTLYKTFVQCDLDADWPLEPCSHDLVLSHSVLEHIRSPKHFFREAFRVLKPGGHVLCLCPNRYAPFAVLNRILPARASQWLLRVLTDRQEGIYSAYYIDLWPSRLMRILTDVGFAEIRMLVTWEQSDYYCAIPPVYWLSRLYEKVLERLGVSNLCAYILIMARRP